MVMDKVDLQDAGGVQGRMLDTDSHETVPSHRWHEEFGSLTRHRICRTLIDELSTETDNVGDLATVDRERF
jgi:hypothetical protein